MTLTDVYQIIRRDGSRQGADVARLGMPQPEHVEGLITFDDIDRMTYPAVIPLEEYSPLIAEWADYYRLAAGYCEVCGLVSAKRCTFAHACSCWRGVPC
jgi:hypothetical protein